MDAFTPATLATVVGQAAERDVARRVLQPPGMRRSARERGRRVVTGRVYVAVIGTVFGAVYALRALVMSDRFAGPYLGRIIGLQALFVAATRALGPLTIGAIGTSPAAYEVGFRLAAGALLVLGRAHLDVAATLGVGGGLVACHGLLSDYLTFESLEGPCLES